MHAVQDMECEDMGSNVGDHPLEGLPETTLWPMLTVQERDELLYQAIRQLAQFAWYSHVHTKAALDDLAEAVRAAEGMRPRGQ